MNSPKQLIDFPQFIISSVSIKDRDVLLNGIFNRVKGVSERRSWLIKEQESFIGDLKGLDFEKQTAEFVTPDERAKNVSRGDQFTWIDGYWNASLILRILDKNKPWFKEVFEPTDAQEFIQGKARGWTKVGSEVPKDAERTKIIPKGWDHEHCEICRSEIGAGGNLIGYKDEENLWLCQKCYDLYASRNDLSFLQA